MPRLAALLLTLATCLLTATPASAVITAKVRLKDVLDKQSLIFTAEVESVQADEPAVAFQFTENLKGKAPFKTLTVTLTGDSYAKKGDEYSNNEPHSKVMLDRLAAGRKLVLFVEPRGKGFAAFGFIEGTWFQMRGRPEGEAIRWELLHCEPYLRRTFKGTTDELRTTVVECLAGKRKPPELDEKEPPGFGPPAERGMRNAERGIQTIPHSAFRVPHSALFAVIPSFLLVGPLAVIAALFPGLFARLAIGVTTWRAFLIVASINCTLALVYWGLRELHWLPDSPWVGPPAVAGYLLAVTGIGLIWSGRRYRRLAALNPDITAPPTHRALLTLTGLTAAVGLLVGLIGYFMGWGEVFALAGEPIQDRQSASGMGKEFTAIATGLAAATLYGTYRWLTRDDTGPVRLSLSGESVGLAAMFLFGASVLIFDWPRQNGSAISSVEIGETTAATVEGPKLAEVGIWYETTDFAEVLSPVVVAGDRVYFGARKEHGLFQSGAVVCLDRASGKEQWWFDDGGSLMPVFAAPTVSDGQVFAGEGLHTDADRRLFRLDARTGQPSWPSPVQTTSHTEGTPRVVDGKVYFSAGDDGLYCVNATDGSEVWHFRGNEQGLHIDTPPAVANGLVFAGSGYRTLALLGLDASTGTEIWRSPVGLRSFGPPLVYGDRVIYGLGTGNLVDDLSAESEEGIPPEQKPAGAVICVEAATGNEVWRFDMPKSVHTRLVADARSVYATCKDGSVYALDRVTGKLRWRRSIGAALSAGPTVATYAGGALTLAVYAVSRDGLVACLSPADGRVYWVRDLSAHTGRKVLAASTPVVLSSADGSRRELLFGAMLTNRNTTAKSAAVFRIEDVIGDRANPER